MAKDFSKSFYNSKAWQRCRTAYIQERYLIDGGMCELCRKRPGYILHHKILLTEANINDANATLDPNNMMYVCKQCHDMIHDAELNGNNGNIIGFDSDGDVISLDDTLHR